MNFKIIIVRDTSLENIPYHVNYINEKAKLYKQNEISACHELEVGERLTTNGHKRNLGKVIELFSILIFVFAIQQYNLPILI